MKTRLRFIAQTLFQDSASHHGSYYLLVSLYNESDIIRSVKTRQFLLPSSSDFQTQNISVGCENVVPPSFHGLYVYRGASQYKYTWRKCLFCFCGRAESLNSSLLCLWDTFRFITLQGLLIVSFASDSYTHLVGLLMGRWGIFCFYERQQIHGRNG